MRRVILADDSKTIQKIVSLSLAEEEFEVQCFENGATALEHIRRRGGDVVLADVSLPTLDGYELCRELKEDPRTASLPVVLLGGTLDPVEEERAREAGYDGALTKPFDISRLVELIDEMCARETEASAGPDAPGRAAIQVGDQMLLFHLPTGKASGRLLFDLAPEECLPSFEILQRRVLGREPVELSSLSERDFEALVNEISKRLPDTLRDMLPDLLRRGAAEPPSRAR